MDRPKIKDKEVLSYVEYLEEKLKSITENSYYPSYVSMKLIVDSINNQIQKIQINITADEGDDQFKVISKYADQLRKYSEQMDFFKSKMNPSEIVSADQKVKDIIVKEGGVEEYLKNKK